MPKLLCFCGLLLGAALLAPSVNAQKESNSFKDKIIVVPLRSSDLEDSRRIREWDLLLKKAQEDKAKQVIFDINVKGDLKWEDQEKILESLTQLTIPTIAFVNPSATGTGSLIAIGCNEIYLSPSAIIGAAGVELSDSKNEEVQKRLLAKHLSLVKARARNLAKRRGHRVDVAEAFVDSEKEIKYGEEVISPKGEVLTLTATEAIRIFDGKPLLAKGVAKSVEDLLKLEAISDEPKTITPKEFTKQRTLERIKTDPPSSASEEQEQGDKSIFSKRTGESYKDKVIVIKVGEDALSTGKARFEFMDRTLKKAELDKAAAVVFDIDTPGGFAWYTQGLLLNSLQSITIPTYGFVNTRAESAGAIIALGTDSIYMRSAATIGSALVVSGAGGDLSTAMESKVTQMIISVVRNTAELKGHNPDVAEAFVTRDKEVIIDGTVIHPKGKVLNLNTKRATEIIDGSPVLAKGVANSIDQIIEKEGIKGEIIEAEVLGMEGFAHFIQRFSFILIIFGIAGVYLETQSPGFGLPGIIGVLSFGLYFFGNNVAGNLAGYETAVVFALGLILIGIEIFLFPGAVIPAVIGALLVVGSLGYSMINHTELEWSLADMPDAEPITALLKDGFINVGLGIIGGGIAVLAIMRFFPKTPIGNRLTLSEAIATGGSIDGQTTTNAETNEVETVSYLGLEGESTTDLRPAGKGRFRGKLLDIIADGEFISKDTAIVVVKHEGSRIVVRKA